MKSRKIIIVCVGLLLLSVLLNINNVQAALQSNGNTSAKYNIDDWMLKIRQMQQLGGTLGLTDTINTTNLTSNSTNLDIHMQKNTEYGAMAILSASSYGNPNKINDGETTTGNKTGVVMQINKEWVSASVDIDTQIWKQSSSRYKNVYDRTYTEKTGDAILDWHGSTSKIWINATIQKSTTLGGLLRSYSGSIYSYYGAGTTGGSPKTDYDAYHTKPWSSRAVIVVGEGI